MMFGVTKVVQFKECQQQENNPFSTEDIICISLRTEISEKNDKTLNKRDREIITVPGDITTWRQMLPISREYNYRSRKR